MAYIRLVKVIMCVLGYMFLPKDNQREIESTNNKGIVFIFKKDFSYLFGFIKNKENKIFKTIFIEYILILLLMQIVIQYWQPYAFGIEPKMKYNVIYSLFFSFLLSVQSLAFDL